MKRSVKWSDVHVHVLIGSHSTVYVLARQKVHVPLSKSNIRCKCSYDDNCSKILLLSVLKIALSPHVSHSTPHTITFHTPSLGSASACLNAEVMARTVQSRIDSSKTSQGILSGGGSTIYSREPNRRNSFFIGNLTWVGSEG